MDEAVQAFLLESHENLQQMEKELVQLEQHPDDRELIASIFRTVHTVKGTCGFFAFSRLEALSHAGESLLSRLRSGEIRVTPEIADALLALVDAIEEKLVSIETRGDEGTNDNAALIGRLTALARPGGTPPPSPPRGGGRRPRKRPGAPARSAASGSRRPPAKGRKPAKPKATAARPAPVAEVGGTGDVRQAVQAATVTESAVRVDVRLLDRLMDLVGELVLVRNRIVQLANGDAAPELGGAAQFLHRITDQLQDDVTRTRLQPLNTLFNRFPRLVRDLAAACGKQVAIEMNGGETELDRSIIESVKDPLVHLIRNAVDHGVEVPETRAAAGKAAQGLITLKAFNEGGQVVIELRDDGAGMDTAQLRRRAVEQGLVAADEAAQLSDREALRLVFLRGFSTARKVTSFSGRGVGMDVVKNNVESIGGTVELNSDLGRGTTTRIKIPLTLAIIPALIVRNGTERYAIPQNNLLELVRLEGQQARGGIERFQGAPVFRLRGKLLPVVHLKHELAGGAPGEFEIRALAREAVTNIIVLQADGRQFGLVVDGVDVTEDIVVKPLGQLLKGAPLYAGATILGDGSVALILDIVGLAQRAHVLTEAAPRVTAARAVVTEEGIEARQVLLFRGPESGRMVIPLEKVARLETFPIAEVERIGGREVVQYRGGILPLVRVPTPFAGERDRTRLGATAEPQELLHVVVFTEEGRQLGLVVDEILDIVEERFAVEGVGVREGVLGSAIVKGRVTELLDVTRIIGDAQARRRGSGDGR
ncbi:MAG TPA: chemotaxis protein CheA [Thermoanaerobaculaceae bacterium]|nr:chemotaxis protein CheA [Thermoanaerobaculaceae bacterium]